MSKHIRLCSGENLSKCWLIVSFVIKYVFLYIFVNLFRKGCDRFDRRPFVTTGSGEYLLSVLVLKPTSPNCILPSDF